MIVPKVIILLQKLVLVKFLYWIRRLPSCLPADKCALPCLPAPTLALATGRPQIPLGAEFLSSGEMTRHHPHSQNH